MGKLIIITAPSGAGKTTIVKRLLEADERLSFSVSATTRDIREGEQDGMDYYFISSETFKSKAKNGEFAEWEEVYPGRFYGTLKTEIQRLWADGKVVVFDIDVLGAVNLQKQYPESSLSIFIKPPSVEVLFERLERRQTESAESLEVRKSRSAKELEMEREFDIVVVNDDLETAIREVNTLVSNFIKPN